MDNVDVVEALEIGVSIVVAAAVGLTTMVDDIEVSISVNDRVRIGEECKEVVSYRRQGGLIT